MSSRSRREVARPQSYKVFNETSRITAPIPDSVGTRGEILSLAMHTGNRSDSLQEIDQHNIRMLMELQEDDADRLSTEVALHINPEDDDLDKDYRYPAHTPHR